jgi:hypothetical protein
LNTQKVAAQQCGYDFYYLFVVNAHMPNSQDKVANLKMYLVDEEEKPLQVDISYTEDNQWKQRRDTLFFWDNEKALKKAERKPLLRQKFYKVGDYYIVAFNLKFHEVNTADKYPIYQLKIESGYDKRTGLSYQEKIVHLPLGNAINICANHLYDDLDRKQPITTFNKQVFKPIDVVLNQVQQQQAGNSMENKQLNYAVRFHSQTLHDAATQTNSYLLNEAKVYNLQTGKLHQEIYIPRITPYMFSDGRNIVKFIDFYQRGITEAVDFSVQIESWRDLKHQCFRQKVQYYIFNPITKKYELDTLLSNYNDVFYDETAKKMRRYDFESNSEVRINYTYQLEGKEWILIDKQEVRLKPLPPKPNSGSKYCVLLGEKSHTLTLTAIKDLDKKVIVKDTFWLYNACNDTIYISKIETAHRDFFSINKTLLPKQGTPLLFNGTITNTGYDFTINIYNCTLTFSDGFATNYGIEIPIIGNKPSVFYRADSTIEYAIVTKPNQRFSAAIFTHPNGSLRAKGNVQDADTTIKVGNWLLFEEGVKGPKYVTYSKHLLLGAFDEMSGGIHSNFKLNVLENGNWKTPVYDIYNNQVRLFITPETDSICAYTDTTLYKFAVNYKKELDYTTKEFYLLKPTEKSIKIGYYQTPFNVIEHQYALILNYHHFKDKNQTSYQLTNSYIESLQKRYPQIATVWISRNQRGISLESLTAEERKRVLQHLVSDSNIAVICQLFTVNHQQRLGFCNQRITAEIDIEDEDEFKRTARKLGFSSIEIDNGNYRFWLTYPGKLIDEHFFEAFDKLTKEARVKAAYFNFYYEQEPDNRDGLIDK